MRVALLSASAAAGDALGHQLAEKVGFFLERGADVRVFLEHDRRLHPAVRRHCAVVPHAQPHGLAWEFVASADLVIADYSQHYGLLDWLPLLAGGRPRVIVDYHGVTPTHLWSAQQREALERGARQRGLAWCADGVLVHSAFAARELLEPTGFPQERAGRIGYPIDTDWFSPGAPRHSLRAELRLEEATLLLFVGRLAPNKRVPVLVEALAQMRERRPAVHALVIGDNTDIYAQEMHYCRQRARELGVAERLHFLGPVSDDRLRDAYRDADVLVIPSRHEGFCIPVVEAQACGLPVVAARAAALPETVGSAGFTFEPDDAADLARQVERVLEPAAPARASNAGLPAAPRRVAIVTCRYGHDFAGGAEASLRTIAQTLQQAGHQVDVFATTLRDLDDWSSQHAEGEGVEDDVAVHRFRPDPLDADQRRAAEQEIEHTRGLVAAEVERAYLTHSIRSHRLVAALRQRVDTFDAVLVGPYLYGLTHDVASAFPAKTLLLPCFHDEAPARLAAFRATYRGVGGILYHSPEEQAFAEAELGLNHPGGQCNGVWHAADAAGDAERGRRLADAQRYLVYCGRYSTHKNLPQLLDYAKRYAAAHPERYRFVFCGQGTVPIPAEPWARDLRFVSEADRRDIVAGAAALLQLSRNESLSLVALEAWAHGVPVIADAACAVLRGQIERSGGGAVVGSYEQFATALDDLWERPERGRERGQNGRQYVHQTYGSRPQFAERLEAALGSLSAPLADQMRRRGRARAELQQRSRWRISFARLVEEWLHAPGRPLREQVELQPRVRSRAVSSEAEAVLVPVRIVNRGTHALAADGPARVCVRATTEGIVRDTPLPGLLLPGRAVTVAVTVPASTTPGTAEVHLQLIRPDAAQLPTHFQAVVPGDGHITLTLDNATPRGAAPAEDIEAALIAAERVCRLPDEYSDVTQGWLATWKHGFKQKLLNNFKRAYVDVLSRQQSAFNRQVLTALHGLSETCVSLHQAVEQGHSAPNSLDELARRLLDMQKTMAAQEERLARLETHLLQEEGIAS